MIYSAVNNQHRSRITIVGFLLMVLLAACSNGEATGSPAEDFEILLQDRSFSPASATIPTGTTVTWVNQDDASHTVTAGTRDEPGQAFDQSISPGETFEYTFTEPGQVHYFCRIHPDMQGQITVE